MDRVVEANEPRISKKGLSKPDPGMGEDGEKPEGGMISRAIPSTSSSKATVSKRLREYGPEALRERRCAMVGSARSTTGSKATGLASLFMPDTRALKRRRGSIIEDGSENGGNSGRAHDGLVTDLSRSVDGAHADDFSGGGKAEGSLQIGWMR